MIEPTSEDIDRLMDTFHDKYDKAIFGEHGKIVLSACASDAGTDGEKFLSAYKLFQATLIPLVKMFGSSLITLCIAYKWKSIVEIVIAHDLLKGEISEDLDTTTKIS